MARNVFPRYNVAMNPETAVNPSLSPVGRSSQPRSTSHAILEWIKTIVIALIIAIPIRYFIAEPFIVNGASMDPTFSTGQFLIVDRLTYRFERPKRGDVIVFEYPNNPNTDYIKRVIGLPGETVMIKDGHVSVSSPADNSKSTKLDEPYVDPMHASHDDMIKTLSATQYFVMGDNRAQSSDSRAWGPLDRRFIIGRPVVRLLPPNEISILPGEIK